MDITIIHVLWKLGFDHFVCVRVCVFTNSAEAVQILVSSLADESSVVREASMASLKDIAALYSFFLTCCL